MQLPKYRIYPSLIDMYQSLLDYELVAEEAWNKVSEAAHNRGEYLDKEIGDFKLTPDEMYLKLEQDLLDAVNRVDGEPSEAADKGTCFNEIVDCLIAKSPCKRKDMQIMTERNEEGTPLCITAKMDGFLFRFDVAMCRQAAKYFENSLSQVLVVAPLETKYGIVELYGYIDEWRYDKIYDIKTTSYYNFGKFERKWQKHVYPYCALASGMTEEVTEFEYSVWKLTKTTPIRGEFYKETYNYDHAKSTIMLRNICERIIEWLIAKDNQGLITNRRIFNEN